jgi:hypothetical protein
LSFVDVDVDILNADDDVVVVLVVDDAITSAANKGVAEEYVADEDEDEVQIVFIADADVVDADVDAVKAHTFVDIIIRITLIINKNGYY